MDAKAVRGVGKGVGVNTAPPDEACSPLILIGRFVCKSPTHKKGVTSACGKLLTN